MRSSIDVKIEQCQNGTSGTTDCTGTPESTRTWTTGSLNSSHSLYREGDFVPFRVILTDLTPDAEYTLRIGYDAVEHDLHERVVDLTFTAEGHTVVLAWGGHIASSLDWGEGNTYVSTFSGAPFHMRLHTLNGHPTGNQDLSLHASALAPRPDPFTTHVTPPSVAVREPVTDTATLGGKAGVPPRGSVAFYICFNATTNPDCRTGGVLAGLPVAVSAHPPARPAKSSP